MIQRLYVPLHREMLERLISLANQEHRSPQDQAVVLLESVLRGEKSTTHQPPCRTPRRPDTAVQR